MTFHKLTSCVIRVAGLLVAALAAWTMASCQMQPGKDQLHGMIDVAFASTAVCQAQQKQISFRNVSGQEIVIDGAAISGGTDPDGNFTILGVKIDADTIPATTGFLNDIHVPAGSNYAFLLTFAPKRENTTQTAVMDIAYSAPQQGIIQVALSGASTSRAATCPTSGGGNPGGGKGDLTGTLSITIDKIALVSSALSQPISTDPDNTVTPYDPVTVPIVFDGAANTVVLPAIGDDINFLLPRTKANPLFNLIKSDTQVTSTADGSGTYSDDGNIEIQNVPIHLNECFAADFTVTLTTGELHIPTNLPKGLLGTAGFTVDIDNGTVSGVPIDPDTLEMTIIGISTFTNTSGPSSCTVAQSMQGTAGAVIIKATVNVPPAS